MILSSRTDTLVVDSSVLKKKRFWKVNYSYGVFLYAKSTNQFLIIQNRDSHAFIYFFMIRDIENWTSEQFKKLFQDFTQDEIQRLLYYSFDDLYNDLYLNHDPIRFKKQEDQARRNYEYFHKQPMLRFLASQIGGSVIGWEFPKGRLSNPGELPIQCAVRELAEESGIQLTLPDVLRQQFAGISQQSVLHDSVMYRATHYVKYKPYMGQRVFVELFGVVVDNPIQLSYKRFPRNIRSLSLSDECLHGRWVNWEDAKFMLSRDVAEVIEPLWDSLQESIPPTFIPCTVY